MSVKFVLFTRNSQSIAVGAHVRVHDRPASFYYSQYTSSPIKIEDYKIL